MGWLNDGVAALWSAGTAARRVFAARRSAPEAPRYATQFHVPRLQTAGVYVTPETALQVAAVWACVSVISKDIAASTWQVFREQDNGDRELARQTSLFRLLNVAPNSEMTAFSFRESLLVSALLWGTGYAEIERDVSGRPVALWPLAPARVELVRLPDGSLAYEIWNPTGAVTVLPARDVFQIHGPGVDGLVGFNVCRLAGILFGHSMAADRFGADFYGNGAHAGQVLETEATLNPEQAKEMREAVLQQLKGGGGQLGLFIATHGAKLKNQAIEPEKAQFIETRQHLIEEVARWFDVPPHKIGHLLRASFSNIEEQGKDYVNKIVPWCERLKQECGAKLVLARNVTTRIEVDWLAEGNAKDKADADSILVNNGIQTRNEVRRRRGLNGMGPDGDKITVQMAMTTLERIGEEPAAPGPAEGAPPAEPDGAPADSGPEPDNRLRLIEP